MFYTETIVVPKSKFRFI